MSRYALAKEILTRILPPESFVPQSAESWGGDFPLPKALETYYQDLRLADIHLENFGNSIYIPALNRLWSYQAGYRFDGLTRQRVDDWKDYWLVIADQGADPFIFSISSENILFDFHGQGEWNPDVFFSDLPSMITSFAIMGEIVVKAGADFTDDNSYIRPNYISAAQERLSSALNSRSEAESILHSLGWLE